MKKTKFGKEMKISQRVWMVGVIGCVPLLLLTLYILKNTSESIAKSEKYAESVAYIKPLLLLRNSVSRYYIARVAGENHFSGLSRHLEKDILNQLQQLEHLSEFYEQNLAGFNISSVETSSQLPHVEIRQKWERIRKPEPVDSIEAQKSALHRLDEYITSLSFTILRNSQIPDFQNSSFHYLLNLQLKSLPHVQNQLVAWGNSRAQADTSENHSGQPRAHFSDFISELDAMTMASFKAYLNNPASDNEFHQLSRVDLKQALAAYYDEIAAIVQAEKSGQNINLNGSSLFPVGSI